MSPRATSSLITCLLGGLLVLPACSPRTTVPAIKTSSTGQAAVAGKPPAAATDPSAPRPAAPTGGSDGPAPERPTFTPPPLPPASSQDGVDTSVLPSLTGAVTLPATLIGDHGAGILSNNGANILSNNGASVISNNGSTLISNNGGNFISKTKYRVLGTPSGADGSLTNALLYLTNRDEKFFRNTATGEVFAARTDATGAYRFGIVAADGFPLGKDVIVNALVDGNLRLSGYIRPIEGPNALTLTLGSTMATELLRARAYGAGRTLASYDATRFYQLATLTQQAIRTGDIEAVKQVTDQVGQPITVGTFDLRLDQLPHLRNQYVVAISAVAATNALIKQISDGWAALLGQRPVAVTTLVGNGKVPRVETAVPATEGDGAAADPSKVPVGTALGVAVSKRGDVFFSGITDAANLNTAPAVGFVRWRRPNGQVSTLWFPRSTYPVPPAGYLLASGYGLAIEKEPTDDLENSPGMLLVADLTQHRVYRVPIVDRQVLDPMTGKEKWPITIVAGEGPPAAPNTSLATNPDHPRYVEGGAPAASTNPATITPATSRFRLEDEGPRTYKVGNGSHPMGSLVPGAARFAWLNKPVDVKLDDLGNIYIADLGNHRIRMVLSQKGEDWLVANNRNTFFDYRTPVDGNGDGLIADTEFATAAATPRMKAGYLYTIAGNPRWSNAETSFNNGFWVGEYADSDGQRAQTAKFDQPAALAWRDGYLYVTDRDNQRIRRISRDTGLIATFAGAPSGPRRFDALTLDADYPPGTAGDGGPATAAELAYPRGLAFDARGRLYLCDTDSGRLRMVDLDGTIRTVAGRQRTPEAAFTGTDHQDDGDALGWADLFEHWFVDVDPNGNLVFNDARHFRVRQLWRQWE